MKHGILGWAFLAVLTLLASPSARAVVPIEDGGGGGGGGCDPAGVCDGTVCGVFSSGGCTYSCGA